MIKCRVFLFSYCIYFFVISIPLSAAESQTPQQILDWQKAAQDYVAQSNPTQAIVLYRNVTGAFPATVYAFDAWAHIARLSITTEDNEQLQTSVNQLCTAYRDQPGMFRSVFDIVIDCAHTQKYTEAFLICTEARKQLFSHPRAILILGWLGMVYAHQGNLEQARQMKEIVSTSESSASDFLDAMSNIGWGHFCNGKWDEALTVYRQGIERHPNHKNAASLQYHIIQTFLAKGDIESANKEIETLLTKYGHREYTLGLACRLAGEFRKRGNPQQAVEIYQRLLTQFPSHKNIAGVQDSLADAYLEKGDLAKAQEAIKTDIELYPGRSELLRTITHVAVETARSGDADKALELAKAIFDQNPQAEDQLFAYTTKARVFVHQGKDADAKAIADEMLIRFKDKPDSLIYHLFGIGEEYYYLVSNQQQMSAVGFFRSMEAIDLWGKLPNLNQNHKKVPDILYYSGLIYWRQNDYGNALPYFMQLAADWPAYKNIEDSLLKGADCFSRLHERTAITSKEAEEGLETILNLLVSNHSDASVEDILWKLGQLKFKSEKWSDAARYLEMGLSRYADNTSRNQQARYLLGQSYENTGNTQKAVQYYIDYLDAFNTNDLRAVIDIQKKIQQLQLKMKRQQG